jgi:hypothetical protein
LVSKDVMGELGELYVNARNRIDEIDRDVELLGRPQPLIKSNPMDIDEQIITLPMTSDSPLSNKTKWGMLDYFC